MEAGNIAYRQRCMSFKVSEYARRNVKARSLRLCGVGVCIEAARFLLSISPQHIVRLKDGAGDLRTKEYRARPAESYHKESGQSVVSFLWLVYHWEGQGAPDKSSYGTALACPMAIRFTRTSRYPFPF